MIKVQQASFHVDEEYRRLLEASRSPGAIVTFCGLVRDFSGDQQITAIELEHYPGMTERVLNKIADEARGRWTLDQVHIIHRIGKLAAYEPIVFVGVSSAHRADAFSACEFIMDFLKTQAPFWKKEFTPNGSYWVEAKDSDESAAQRWKNQNLDGC